MRTNYDKYIKVYKGYKKFEEDKKLVWSRYYFDDYSFSRRVGFVLALIQNYIKKEFTLEVKFWEENSKIIDFFKEMQNSYAVVQEYKNGEEPGIIVIDDKNLDIKFFEQLLQRHYNHDLAYEPALSVKLLLFVNSDENLTVFDLYDDRGFIINHYYYNQEEPLRREAQLAIEQLNQRYEGHLNFSLNENSIVEVSVAGEMNNKRMAKEAEFMLQAVNNKDIIVNIYTFGEDEMFNEEGVFRNIGAFHGNEVSRENKVHTRQEVIPSLAKEMDDYYEAQSGTVLVHEILESYVGGLYGKKSEKSIPNGKINPNLYLRFHNDRRVPKQPGEVYRKFYDEEGNVVPINSDKIKSGELYFEKRGKERKVILKLKEQ